MRGWIAASTAVLMFSLGCGLGSQPDDATDAPATADGTTPVGDDGTRRVDDDTPPPPDLAALRPSFRVSADTAETGPRAVARAGGRGVAR